MRKSYMFTLLEIIIVLVIISILVAVAVPSYLGTSDKANAVKIRNDLDSLNLVIGQYIMNNAKYPLTLRHLVTEGLLIEYPRDPFDREYVYDKKSVFYEGMGTQEVYFLQADAYYANDIDIVTPTIEVVLGVDPGDE